MPTTTSKEEVEFRTYDDDAWYNVIVTLIEEESGGGGAKLSVHYCSLPGHRDHVLDAYVFDSFEKVEDLRSRFRPPSVQLQDNECRLVEEENKICASHQISIHDVKFYDATVEQVIRREHSIENGEEVCLCSFVLAWEHGPNTQLLSEKKIESICIVQPSDPLDPVVDAFVKIVKKRIESTVPAPSGFTAPAPSGSNAIIVHSLGIASYQDGTKSPSTNKQISNSLDKEMRQTKSTNISPYGGNNIQKKNGQDADVGGSGNHFYILVQNLEKELSSSTIVDFIRQQRSINVRASIYPGLPSECYTRGVIVVYSREDFKDLTEFLNYPGHFIISSKGRPWVVTNTIPKSDTFKASIGTSACKRKPQNADSTTNELKVVWAGTEEFNKAKELRDLLKEFITHLEGLHKQLAHEEQKIFGRSATAM